ncbi:hypothetical protein HDU85_002179 [Gaertneriomyces sp. JEL0708]|nr:hypothetical protein HDU85_002179 [Gaertneriomyces sp. JEL0708]
MKLLAVAITLLAATSSVQAWRLRLYKDKDYKNQMGDYTGNTGSGRDSPCYSVTPNDAASSFKWQPCYSEGRSTNALMVLYKDGNCRTEIGRANGSGGDWNNPKMGSNDVLTSFRVYHDDGYQC